MQKPTIERIDELLSEISKVLNDGNIPYLVYGSYAYLYYSKSKEVLINDIDIIIEKKNFKEIQKLFSNYNMPYKLYLSEHTIHANHKYEVGNDGKPFDISFDSYDHYFLNNGIDLKKFCKKVFKNNGVRLIKKDGLLKIYEIGLNSNNMLKNNQYLKKLR